jgi:hypothetical protein
MKTPTEREYSKYDPSAYEDSPKKDCPWKCKPGDPKCLCEPLTNGQRG